jgi:branched-chain amino acid aminotransferase
MSHHDRVMPFPIAWIDGALRDESDASISAWDHGLTVGDGVFETMKVTQGVAFALGRHLARLRRSAGGLGFEVPLDDDRLRSAVSDTIAANDVDHGRLRLTVTGGVGPLGSDRGGARPTVIVAIGPLAPWRTAAAVSTVPWSRNEHSAVAGLKTVSYAENVVALQHAHEHGAEEAIFANTAGHLCEGTGTNIFVSLDGRLVTPPLSSGCLAGVTRELVIEALQADELAAVSELDAPYDVLESCAEAFLTSSTRDVQPIGSIDGRSLSAPGPLTQRAIDAFRDLEATTLDP